MCLDVPLTPNERSSLTQFSDLGLHKQVLKALDRLDYATPTPIQAQAIPDLLAGRDLLGIAQTGTGKTAAFALPTLHRLLEAPLPRRDRATRVLVLAPTRELALQIADSFQAYARFTDFVVRSVFGGVKTGGQIRSLERGCDVLVATPGRLLDLTSQGALDLGRVETLILDEADQMLDMGFIHDLRKIVAQVPATRQTLLFSATMPTAIGDLAGRYLTDPVHVSVTPQSTTAERVRQGVLHMASSDKPRLLAALLEEGNLDRTLVFAKTKHGADRLVRGLMAKGVSAQAIHGNKSQTQRVKALAAFKDGRCNVLVATDIAARGIDIDGISHVVNYDMPTTAEQYVHRIGRTARAGREGQAVSFVGEDELYYLREVEKTTGVALDLMAAPNGCESLVRPAPDPNLRVQKPKGPARGGGGGGGSARRRGGGASPRQGAPGKNHPRAKRRAANG